MPIQTLEIHFKGICTHFHNNFISGFPHRVVLPNASHVVPGLLTGPFVDDPGNPDNWLPYVLLPHVPLISIENLPSGDVSPFTTPGLFAQDGSGTSSPLPVSASSTLWTRHFHTPTAIPPNRSLGMSPS